VDYLRLKAALLTAGVSAAPEALVGLGERFKEQNHGLFGWDFEDHVDSVLPDDFSLPDGTVVQFRQSSLSPYRVEVDGGRRVLLERGQEVCPVNWIERPAYYGRADSAGRPMVKTGQIGGADCLFFCYQNYCSHFSTGQQCLFCNLVATSRTYGSVLKKKDVESIGEVAAAAWPEGAVKHVLLTGGCFRAEREVDLVCDIIASIRRHTGLERVPGTARGDSALPRRRHRRHRLQHGDLGPTSLRGHLPGQVERHFPQ